tara:strand:- start:40 stop:276 length:237 start_codon:yes stop_codon:yes gene_type:complete
MAIRKILLNVPRYQFSEIPNNDEGREFVRLVRKYGNTERYKIRVRGQHLNDGEDWRKYVSGQPINKSKHLRVYMDDLT